MGTIVLITSWAALNFQLWAEKLLNNIISVPTDHLNKSVSMSSIDIELIYEGFLYCTMLDFRVERNFEDYIVQMSNQCLIFPCFFFLQVAVQSSIFIMQNINLIDNIIVKTVFLAISLGLPPKDLKFYHLDCTKQVSCSFIKQIFQYLKANIIYPVYIFLQAKYSQLLQVLFV